MTYYDPDEPISVVEDLDPEPPGKPGLSQRLELLVGVFVLVVVLSFVGWQWWHQQVQVSSYAAGQTALANVDWDAALSDFTQTGDYRDAAQQADHARQQVGTRNRLYASAQQHAKDSEWLEALTDVRAAALIQPGYRDLDTQEQTALRNVYTGALSGTVAMRTDVTPSGLYYYNGDDWIYLQESDERSTVMDTDGHGRLIYDVPGAPKGSKPLLASPPYMQIAVGNIRYYRVATLTGQGFIFSRLDIDPEHYSQIIMNAEGAWGFSYGDSIGYIPQGPENSINPIVRSNYVAVNLAYQSFDGPIQIVQTRQIFTNIAGSNIVVAIDPLGDRYLTIDYANAHNFTAASDTVISLYLNEAGSTSRQLIYTHTGGGLQSAQLSPDGRYALVNVAYFKSDGSREKVSSILLDLQGAQTPRVVQDVTTSPSVPIGTAFVRGGVFAGDIVLYEPGNNSTRLVLVDPSKVGSPDNPQGITKDMTVENQPGDEWVIMNGNGADDGLLLMGQSGVSPSYPASYILTLVNMPAQGPAISSNVSMPANSYFGSIQLKGNNAAWVTDIYPRGGTSNVVTSINVVTLSKHDNDVISPTVVFTSTYDPIAKNVNTTPSISLGDRLIAYSLNKQLHVRNYAGSADIVLESGLSYIINYRSEMTNPFWGFLR